MAEAQGVGFPLRRIHVPFVRITITKRTEGVQHIPGIRSLAFLKLAQTIDSLAIEERKGKSAIWQQRQYASLIIESC